MSAWRIAEEEMAELAADEHLSQFEKWAFRKQRFSGREGETTRGTCRIFSHQLDPSLPINKCSHIGLRRSPHKCCCCSVCVGGSNSLGVSPPVHALDGSDTSLML